MPEKHGFTRRLLFTEMFERDGGQGAFDGGAFIFEVGWEFQGLAELVQWFIDLEAGAIGGYFEEYAAGLSEVDGSKIISIQHGSRVELSLGQQLACLVLGLAGGGGEGDVVDRAAAGKSSKAVGHAYDIDVVARSIGGCKAEAIASLGNKGMIHLLGEQACCPLVPFLAYLDVVKTFDGVLGRDMSVDEAGAMVLVRKYELQAQSIEVLEIYKHFAGEAFLRGLKVDLIFCKAPYPIVQGGCA